MLLDYDLEEAHAAGKLLHRMKTLIHPSLLVVDEIGYLPVSRAGAMHFFQLMSRRYEPASGPHQQQELPELGRDLRR